MARQGRIEAYTTESFFRQRSRDTKSNKPHPTGYIPR
jgi:hypothetical protein